MKIVKNTLMNLGVIALVVGLSRLYSDPGLFWEYAAAFFICLLLGALLELEKEVKYEERKRRSPD